MTTGFVLGAVAVAGCDAPAPGERASEQGCPVGETCSDETPRGLYFGGARLGERIFDTVTAPRPTVVGGTQTITVYWNANASSEFSSPFDAVTTGDALVVEAAEPPRVWVRAMDSGDEYLRIVERGTDELLDRVRLPTVSGVSVQLRPYLWGLYDQALLEGAPFALWAGTYTDVVVALVAGERRAVDDSMRIGLPDGWLPRLGRWDSFTAAPVQVGTYQLELEIAGDAPFVWPLRAVDRVEDIIWVVAGLADRAPADGLMVGGTALYCFRALSEGEAVVGAPFEIHGSGPISVTHSEDDSCAHVRRLEEGAAIVTVSVGETRRSFSLAEPSALRAGARADAAGETVGGSVDEAEPGERAAASLAR